MVSKKILPFFLLLFKVSETNWWRFLDTFCSCILNSRCFQSESLLEITFLWIKPDHFRYWAFDLFLFFTTLLTCEMFICPLDISHYSIKQFRILLLFEYLRVLSFDLDAVLSWRKQWSWHGIVGRHFSTWCNWRSIWYKWWRS